MRSTPVFHNDPVITIMVDCWINKEWWFCIEVPWQSLIVLIWTRAWVSGGANEALSNLNSSYSSSYTNLLRSCVVGQRKLMAMWACLVSQHHWVIGKSFGREANHALKWFFHFLYCTFCSICVMIIWWDIVNNCVLVCDRVFYLSGGFIVQFV